MRRRLDSLLVDRGLYRSRTKAAAAVLAGDVRLDDRARAPKPGDLVPDDVGLEVASRRPYVSRGGVKLANALDALGVDVADRHCLDVGASTGGFTDCLLQRGAASVVALDVAYGALDWRLRGDSRVTVLERTNARDLTREDLPRAPEVVTVDVSFIGLAKVLPAVLATAEERFDCLALVKPQFEVGRERVGKGGVVRSAADRRRALEAIGGAIRSWGHSVLGFAPSGLPGPAGNRETFVWASEGGRSEAVDDVAGAARRAEP